MTTKSSKADALESSEPCRIRHRDTGGIREITEAQWRKEKEELRAEGFVRVDENDLEMLDEADD